MRIGRQGEVACASHVGPVISKYSATDEADLVVLAIQTTMGPGEPVRAKSGKQALEELGHAGLAPSYCETNRRLRGLWPDLDRADSRLALNSQYHGRIEASCTRECMTRAL
jgi:hypothetical protein